MLADATAEHGAAADCTARGWFLDVADVFECFVRVGLREAWGLAEAAFPTGKSVGTAGRILLDDAGRIRLEPDLSRWHAGRCVLIGDAKYRRSEDAGLFDPDLKQALAYALAARLPEAWIVYATLPDESAVDGATTVRGHTLRRVGLDLDRTPADLLAGIRELAKQMDPRTLAIPA